MGASVTAAAMLAGAAKRRATAKRFGRTKRAATRSSELAAWKAASGSLGDLGEPLELPLRGHRKTQTTITLNDSVAELVSPYVEGSEQHVRFT